MKKRRLLSMLMSGILMVGSLTAGLWYEPQSAYAAAATALAAQINLIGGLTAITPVDPNVIEVSGSASSSSTITLNIDPNVTINWDADLSGSTASGKYLLNLSGGGTFNLTGGAEISNSSGIITVTGDRANVNIDSGTLSTPASGNGISINIAAKNVTVNVNAGGSILNNGSNSAINVTAGAAGVRINVSGSVVSEPAGYAISDGGTTLCTNDTLININGGEVTAGSACAIKSTGADSVVVIMGGEVSNAATVNSNPVIYMNGGLGDNVTVGGKGKVIASDNNLGYGIQTTGNVLVMDEAEVIATAGRAVNLVGMDSTATVNGGLVTATTGVAICTATTNPASVENARIIINGGEVSTTDPDKDDKSLAVHGASRTIYATGAYNEVIINGGWVYTTWDNTEAVYVSGAGSMAVVNGGWVTARDHFAIEAYSGGYVYINGGFVFAYGNDPLSFKTGAAIKTSAAGAISRDKIVINGVDGSGASVSSPYANGSGNGVVVTWDREEWKEPSWDEDDYTEGSVDHLASDPSGLAYWHNNGGPPNDGVYYKNSGNAGFFPLYDVQGRTHDDVSVTPPIPPNYSLEVQNGAGSGLYKKDALVGIVADSPPAGKEFDYWHVISGSGVSFSNGYSETTSFVMPDDNVVIEALYTDKFYILAVTGGDGSGSFTAGSLAHITAAAPPSGKEFDRWTGGANGSFGNVFSIETDFLMPASDAAVTAEYRDVPLFSFSLAGGSIVSSSIPQTGGKYPAGTVITINGFSSFPSGYSFSGWLVKKGGGSFFENDAFEQFNARFIMPAADSAVEMNQPFSMRPDPLYLSVINGTDKTGDETYSAGRDVDIVADPAPEGKVFAGWTVFSGRGIFADASAMSTKFRMSDISATVKANYEDVKYALFVEYGEITGNSIYAGKVAGNFTTGDTVSLMAVRPVETDLVHYVFSGWTVSGGGGFDDEFSEETVFTMPDNAVVITAHWTPVYRLLVLNGEIVAGEFNPHFGYYAAGVVVGVDSSTATYSSDYVFGGWQARDGGSFENANEITTTFTMPANDALVIGEYVYAASTETYKLTVAGGTISQSGAVKGNPDAFLPGTDDIEIRLDPASVPSGHVFTGWTAYSDEGASDFNYGSIANPTSTSTSFIMPEQNITVTANYAEVYTLYVDTGNGGGLQEIPGIHTAGERISITATDRAGKVFVEWTSNDGSFVNASMTTTTFIMPAADAKAVAVYEDLIHPLYSLTTVICHSEDHGPFEEGASVSVIADTLAGKIFDDWEISGIDIGSVVFTGPESIRFIMPGNNVAVTALLADIKYTLSVVDGTDNTGAGVYPAGEYVYITASPALPGKVFSSWTSDGGGSFIGENVITTSFIMPANDVIVKANYKDDNYTLTVENGILENGTDSGIYIAGESVAITAQTPLPGKDFAKWVSNSGGWFENENDEATEFIMPANDVIITAIFTTEDEYILTVENGTGSGSYAAGEDVSLTALTPSSGKVFDKWASDNNGSFDDENAEDTIFTMPANDVTVTAIFADDNYNLTVGNGTGSGIYAAGENVSITASSPPSGKIFDKWVSNGGGSFDDENGEAATFTMPANDVIVIAVYITYDEYNLTVVSGTGSGLYAEGDSVAITASAPLPGRVFARWVSNGGGSFDDESDEMTTFYMPGNDVTVTATYKSSRTDRDPPAEPYYPPIPSAAASGSIPAPSAQDDKPPLLNTMEHMAYVRGVGNDLFAPDKDMTRAETAQMFYNLLLDKNIGFAGIFPDIPEQAWYKKAAETLSVLGVVVGRPDGNFYPEDSITRAEFVAIAVKFIGEKPDLVQTEPFTDVFEGHWAYSYINEAAGYGWVQGVGDGRFDPDRHISRAEVVTMTNRMFLRVPDEAYIDSRQDLIFYSDVPKSYWAFHDIAEASNAHDYTKDENGGETWKGN